MSAIGGFPFVLCVIVPSETARQALFNGSQDFGQDGTGRTSNQSSDGIEGGDSSYVERYPNELSMKESTTLIQSSTQSATDGNAQANSKTRTPKRETDLDSNVISRPLIIHKSERVNAVTYENQEPTSENSEDGDATTTRDPSSTSRQSLRSVHSRHSVSNSPDPSTTISIPLQQRDVGLQRQYHQPADSGNTAASSHYESIESNHSPTRRRSEEFHLYSDGIPENPDHPKRPPTDESERPITGDLHPQLYREKQNKHQTITGQQSPSQYGDSPIGQRYEEHRNSPVRKSPSYRSRNSRMHSRHNIREAHSQLTNPSPDWQHPIARSLAQTPYAKSTDVANSPVSSERHEVIRNFMTKENISTSIPQSGLQPISRGTPDGTHVSRRQDSSSVTTRENISTTIRHDDEEPSNVVSYSDYSHIEQRNGYVDPHARSDLLLHSRNHKTRINPPSISPGDISSSPSQGHESALSVYQESQDANGKFRHEPQIRRDFDEDSHLRKSVYLYAFIGLKAATQSNLLQNLLNPDYRQSPSVITIY